MTTSQPGHADGPRPGSGGDGLPKWAVTPSPLDALYEERAKHTSGRLGRWQVARKKAQLRGEFLDPCEHGNILTRCSRWHCAELARVIVEAYL